MPGQKKNTTATKGKNAQKGNTSQKGKSTAPQNKKTAAPQNKKTAAPQNKKDATPQNKKAATPQNAVVEKTPRKRVTYESHMKDFDSVLEQINEAIENKSKEGGTGVRELKSIRKAVEKLQKDTKKIAAKRPRNNTNSKNKKSGFSYKCRISKDLADFLHVTPDTTMTRKEVTNAMCAYVHVKDNEKREEMLEWGKKMNPGGKRNLQDPNDGMVILPDKPLAKLLNYDQYKKDVKAGKVETKRINKETRMVEMVTVEDPVLKYCTMQKLLSPHFLETVKSD